MRQRARRIGRSGVRARGQGRAATWASFSDSLQRFTIWALHRDAAPLESTNYTVLGKPAEAAVREVFKRRSVR